MTGERPPEPRPPRTSSGRQTPSLEGQETQPGLKPGDRYVRILRPGAREFRRVRGHYVATEEALTSRGTLGRIWGRLRRFLLGPPLGAEAEEEQRVSKLTGLAVLAPSNISSSAYATEEAMRALAVAGAAAITLAMPIALAVIAVLAVVVLSEARVIRMYPGGGGSYVVARDNIGVVPGLVAASALLVDYVLTVAVSTAAGVVAISSFAPALAANRVPIALGLISLLALGHMRGVREAGAVFALPTYTYIGALFALVAVGIGRIVLGDVPAPVIPRDPQEIAAVETLTVLVLVRGFAAGAVALTGSEAVANVVTSFRAPQARNAILTLLLMTGSLAALFLGLTFLATKIGIGPDAVEVESVNSMIARSVFGDGTAPYLAIQLATAAFLLVAANTGFSGFPRLASLLANDRFMPRQFADRGARLSHSFGILALAGVAALILVVFGGSVNALVPLYTIAVFLSFFLSQSGLLRHALRERVNRWRAWAVVNGAGAGIMGALVLVIAITRLREAWIVIVLVPVLVLLLFGVNRHYRQVAQALALSDPDGPLPEPQPPAVIVPVARLDRAAVQALTFARSISPDVRAVHIATTPESAEAFARRWESWPGKVPLDLVESPYRSLVAPLLRYIERVDELDPRPITVVLSEYVPNHWWEWLLHSQTAFRLKAALLFRPNTIVIDVPYHHRDTGDIPGGPPAPRANQPRA